MISGDHVDEALLPIDRVEKSIISDAASPGVRHGIPKLLNVRPDVGVLPKLRVDVGGEFAANPLLLPAEILLEISVELRRLKNTELSQQASLCAVWRLDARPGASP